MVPTGEDVTIDLKEVDGFFEYAKEFTVFVQHNCVAETKTQLDFHNTQANDDEVACWMGFMTENPDMPHAVIKYTSQPSNQECFPAE